MVNAILSILFKIMFVIIGIQYVFDGKIMEALICIIILGIGGIIDKLDGILEEMRKK